MKGEHIDNYKSLNVLKSHHRISTTSLELEIYYGTNSKKTHKEQAKPHKQESLLQHSSITAMKINKPLITAFNHTNTTTEQLHNLES